ncbi:MAG: NYN domain-containing protein [Anaerolineae bacterium]|nr:NYN domain-containing protein [Anaerolineae bacterium]
MCYKVASIINIPTSHRVALLIDADNIQLSQLEQILKISDYYGNLEISRAYGDWKKSPLSAAYDDVCNLNIECIQVDRVAKDTTDKQMMIEAGEILGADAADIFIIASGDGDFRLLCERIKHKGRKVVGIGNKGQTSTHLRDSCDAFHYIERLEEALIQLEQTRLQEFKALLFRALDSNPCGKEGWVHCGLVGKKLRELDSGFENRFGGKKLSKWLSDLGGQLDIRGQMVRRLSTCLQKS